MHTGPVHADGGRDEDPAWRVPEPEDWQPVITCPDPLTEEEWLASLDATAREDEPPADEEEWAQDWTEDWAEIEASLTAQSATAQFTAAQFTAAAQFATGRPLDVMPGRAELAQLADEAAGPDDSFLGVSEDELLGVLRAWDRVEAHAAARKFAAVAELMRRRPAPGKVLEGPARMPAECDEFTVCELVTTLALSRWDADDMMSFAYDLAVRLPGTRAAFLDGRINQERAEIIVRATAVLTPEESRAAEALVLGRAAADPQRTSVRDRPRRDPGGAGQGPQTPREGSPGGAGGAVGGGIGEPRAGRAGTARRPGGSRRPEDHRVGQAAEEGRARGQHGRTARPGLPGHAARHRLPPPPGRRR